MSSGKGVIAKVVFMIVKSLTLRLSLVERVLVGFFEHKKKGWQKLICQPLVIKVG